MRALAPALASLLLVGASVALGCEARVSLGGRCSADGDCPAMLVCRFERCRSQCTTASDCRDPGAICIGERGRGVCSVPAVDTCANDCGDGLVCAGETCAVPCVLGAGECLTGSECTPVGAVDVCVATPVLDAGPSDAGPADATVVDADPDAAVAPPATRRGLCLGFYHSCAIRGGRVYCWGSNAAGQLGDGTDDSTSVTHERCGATADCAPSPMAPVQVDDGTVHPLEDVVEITCGESHTCALTRAGDAYCWGASGDSALGRAGRGGHVAVSVPGIADATNIAGGRFHTCARIGSSYRCWGQDVWGPGGFDDRLGTGLPTEALGDEPVDALRFEGFADLAGGGFYTCGIRPEGDVHCQGANEAGVIGDEAMHTSLPRGAVIEGTLGATMLGAGVVHACVLVAGRLACWGGNDHGELATFDANDCPGLLHGRCRGGAAPARDPRSRSFTFVSRGHSEGMCAIDSDGFVACWGRNDFGQAGDPSLENLGEVGDPVLGPGDVPLTNVTEVATGSETTCARDASDRIFCWGNDEHAKRGCGSFDPAPTAHPTACEVVFP